jgi:hypothetical protein
MLPLLTAAEPGHPSFHVVAPSLPGFAWSEGPLNRGFRSKNYVEVGPLPEQHGALHLQNPKALEQADGIARLL